MFLVGGGIIAHGVPFLHHFLEHSIDVVSTLPTLGTVVGSITGMGLNAIIGIASGLVVVLIFWAGKKVLPSKAA
jgi:predicted DNA repair protein MutK